MMEHDPRVVRCEVLHTYSPFKVPSRLEDAKAPSAKQVEGQCGEAGADAPHLDSSLGAEGEPSTERRYF